MMITMHGLFDLKDNCTEAKFVKAYNHFAQYLIEQNLIVSSRAMRRRPDANYDSSPPESGFHITMDFVDGAQASACWDHIENNKEVSHLLHRAVYAQIQRYQFYLTEDIL